MFCDRLALGASIVALGCATAIWLPQGLAFLLLGLAMCRICWIEDNIHSDLLPADEVPSGYRACRERRRLVLGLPLSRGEGDTCCPKLLASQLRLQSLAWSAYAWAILAGATLQYASAPGAACGVLCLAAALRSADYFALGQSWLLCGRPLPRHLLLGQTPLARLAYSSRRPD